MRFLRSQQELQMPVEEHFRCNNYRSKPSFLFHSLTVVQTVCSTAFLAVCACVPLCLLVRLLSPNGSAMEIEMGTAQRQHHVTE